MNLEPELQAIKNGFGSQAQNKRRKSTKCAGKFHKVSGESPQEKYGKSAKEAEKVHKRSRESPQKKCGKSAK